MKKWICLLFCLLLFGGSMAEDDYFYEEEYFEEGSETEYVMIEKELFEYYVEEIIGRAEMTMAYLVDEQYDREEAIYHLDEVLSIAEILQLDYCE